MRQISNEDAQFKNDIELWLKKKKLTKKWLADTLEVNHGTVRNWFSSTNLPIGRVNAEKIHKLMKMSVMGGGLPIAPRCSTFLMVPSIKAETLMWLSAAGVIDGSILDPKFLRSGVPQDQSEQAAFASWATSVINAAIRKELKERKSSEVQAKVFVGAGDAVEMFGEMKDRENKNEVVVYVRKGSINIAFLKAAADFQQKGMGEFVRDALNASVRASFSSQLASFLHDDWQ